MKEAINRAIGLACENDYRWSIDVTEEKIYLDPLFWQALGKSLGWVEGIWEEMWHQFIHHLADGKDPESFFTALLEEQK